MPTTIRPNIRRITSPAARRQADYRVTALWLTAIGITAAMWTGFIGLIAR